MGIELANEKWLDGDASGLLGQFASTSGYSDLIAACDDYPKLAELFETGASENIDDICQELKGLAASAPSDVASTAAGLLKMVKGQTMAIITNGGS